jgi:hypothetical protein
MKNVNCEVLYYKFSQASCCFLAPNLQQHENLKSHIIINQQILNYLAMTWLAQYKLVFFLINADVNKLF